MTKYKYFVVDSEFNREYYRDIINGIYDSPPPYAHVREYCAECQQLAKDCQGHNKKGNVIC